MLWPTVEQGLNAIQMSLQSTKVRGNARVLRDRHLIATHPVQLPKSQIGPRQDREGDHDPGNVLDLGAPRMISCVYIKQDPEVLSSRQGPIAQIATNRSDTKTLPVNGYDATVTLGQEVGWCGVTVHPPLRRLSKSIHQLTSELPTGQDRCLQVPANRRGSPPSQVWWPRRLVRTTGPQ